MSDLTSLTNDELRDHLRAGLREAESRLTGRALKTARLAHALLEQVEEDQTGAGTLSAGGPKEP